MSNPAEKPEVVQLPAEAPVTAPVNTRRVAAQRVREARDRLTSSSGTRPAFDTELLYIARIKGIPIREIPVSWQHDDDSRVKVGGAVMKSAMDLCRMAANRIIGRYS